jgi:uncharacterized protein
MIPQALMQTILAQYPLPLHGVHGPAHWARVYENGGMLAEKTGADLEVVRLFAVLHDSRRFDEGTCFGHGPRAAAFAETLRGTHLHLDDERFALLHEAIARHTDGATEADVTVQTCWDADRLDLRRVWIDPDPARMCTDAARDPKLLAWACRRARRNVRPAICDAWLAGP